MTESESVPTPAPDLRTRLAAEFADDPSRYSDSAPDDGLARLYWEALADVALEVVEPELARFREQVEWLSEACRLTVADAAIARDQRGRLHRDATTARAKLIELIGGDWTVEPSLTELARYAARFWGDDRKEIESLRADLLAEENRAQAAEQFLRYATDAMVATYREDVRSQAITRLSPPKVPATTEEVEEIRARSGRGEVPDDPAGAELVGEFLEWLARMERPDDTQGQHDRRTVTLDAITGRAAFLIARSAVTNPTDGEAGQLPLAPTGLLSQLPDLPDPTGPLVDVEELDDAPTGPVVPAPTEDTEDSTGRPCECAEPDWYHDGVAARVDGRLCRKCRRREGCEIAREAWRTGAWPKKQPAVSEREQAQDAEDVQHHATFQPKLAAQLEETRTDG